MTRDMYEDRNPPSGQAATTRTFSAKDREDAARLLSMIIGEDRSQRFRILKTTTEVARSILEDRKRRARIFNAGMFGEPGWELLLNLYVMDHEGPRLTIGPLVDLAGVSQTTALRWLQYLQDQELVVREENPTDARTAYITLTDKARSALDLYLSETRTRPIVDRLNFSLPSRSDSG